MFNRKTVTIIFLVICALIFSQSGAKSARAESYAFGRVLNKTTYLYNSADESSPSFLIPETYYVKIIRMENDYSLVEYMSDIPPYHKAITGYVKTEQLHLSDKIPENPFLLYNLQVKNNAKGYSSRHLNTDYRIFSEGNPITFYGKMTINGVLFYYALAYGEYRCYISASDAQPLSYELNSDPLPIIPTPEPNPPIIIGDTDTPPASNERLKIALILLLVVPTLLATAYLFKPQKTKSPPAKYYYDESDYE